MTTRATIHPPLPRRIVLKIKRIVRELDKDERDWVKLFPLVEPIEGWLHNGQERWLFRAARALPDGAKIVEIGSYKGRSTCSLALGCKGTRKRVYAIDAFDGGPDLPRADSFEAFSKNIEKCGVGEFVKPLIGTSAQFATHWTEPIHLLFVDGSHKYEDVLADFHGFFPHVVRGGIIAFHDVESNWPGVLRAWTDVICKKLSNTGCCDSLAYGHKP